MPGQTGLVSSQLTSKVFVFGLCRHNGAEARLEWAQPEDTSALYQLNLIDQHNPRNLVTFREARSMGRKLLKLREEQRTC